MVCFSTTRFGYIRKYSEFSDNPNDEEVKVIVRFGIRVCVLGAIKIHTHTHHVSCEAIFDNLVDHNPLAVQVWANY